MTKTNEARVARRMSYPQRRGRELEVPRIPVADAGRKARNAHEDYDRNEQNQDG